MREGRCLSTLRQLPPDPSRASSGSWTAPADKTTAGRRSPNAFVVVVRPVSTYFLYSTSRRLRYRRRSHRPSRRSSKGERFLSIRRRDRNEADQRFSNSPKWRPPAVAGTRGKENMKPIIYGPVDFDPDDPVHPRCRGLRICRRLQRVPAPRAFARFSPLRDGGVCPGCRRCRWRAPGRPRSRRRRRIAVFPRGS